jgi:hypothetical protein
MGARVSFETERQPRLQLPDVGGSRDVRQAGSQGWRQISYVLPLINRPSRTLL